MPPIEMVICRPGWLCLPCPGEGRIVALDGVPLAAIPEATRTRLAALIAEEELACGVAE